MKKYLAVDYGLKRVGLAVNHAWLAEPYGIVPRNEALKKIGKLVKDEHIDEVLVGIAEGFVAEEAKEFAKEIAKATNLPVSEVDETLSSKETHVKLAKGPMRKSRRQEPIDHYAAASFLQDYLDAQPNQD